MSLDGVREGELRPLPFSALAGWTEADLSTFWPAFLASLRAMSEGLTPLRPAQTASSALCARAREIAGGQIGPCEVRAEMERWFQPFAVEGPGFITGYYEPVVDGSWVPSAEFLAPILPRPDDLVTLPLGEGHPAIPPGYTAARRRPDGGLEVTPDRAAIEAHAVRAPETAIVWLRDWVEVFLIQVQGSARVRLPDGSEKRLVYAGRNGHPYSSIGAYLIQSGQIAADAMSLHTLKSWLRAHGQAPGQEGRTIMQRNRSYIYFRLDELASYEGPVGGAGLSLSPKVSIAVDRNIWSYGLPFWIESDAAVPGFGSEPLRRLFVAQDTGSAILGAARADVFLGSGARAGEDAGSIRHPARFTVLMPRPS